MYVCQGRVLMVKSIANAIVTCGCVILTNTHLFFFLCLPENLLLSLLSILSLFDAYFNN